jgi:hypothetical protein
MNDADLDTRLINLAAQAPADELGRGWRSTARRRSPTVSLALGAVLSLTVGAAALAGAVSSGALVIPWTANQLGPSFHPAAENPGQPLAGAGLECMSPRQAADYLAAHGYTKVTWEVDRDGSTSNTPSPPTHGYVIPGAIVNGTLTIVIDQRAGASGVGTCAGMPMP